MKKALFLGIFLSVIHLISAQEFIANTDESKVPDYELPDPLIFNDGTKVLTISDWSKRRSEILHIFENEVYGINPEWKGSMTFTELSSKEDALNGNAIQKEIKLTLQNNDKELEIILLLYLPYSQNPVPVFLGYNFGGNHSVTDDPDILITKSWMRNNSTTGITDHKATEEGRGKGSSRWQIDEIISSGYGLATLYYGDVDPDFDDGFLNGAHGLFEQQPTPTSWGSIGAWAWGLSRVMDYIETVPAIDSKEIILIGHSRLGKTSLWAGATDQRFAMVISNNSGCGGAALSRRCFGETVGRINTSFPHWFCDNFNKYNEKEYLLPVDQHELISLIAPRPVYVASAEDDSWADPKGEFLSCLNASVVYELLGYKGLQIKEMPPVNKPVISTICYHVRSGGHDVTLYDWKQYIDFANRHLKKN